MKRFVRSILPLYMLKLRDSESSGPYADRLGFDQIAQAMSGAMELTGFPDKPPQRSEVRYCDFEAGTFAALGIVMALYHRANNGPGAKGRN